MSKEHGGAEAPPSATATTTPSLFSAAVNKFSRMGSNRNLSPSASKYRVPSFLAATGISVTPASATSQSQPPGNAPASPAGRKFQELARQASVKGSRRLLKFSDVAVSGGDGEPPPGPEGATTPSPTRGKLPQKIRASVTRMRSQLSLAPNNSSGESPTKSRQQCHSTFGLVSGNNSGGSSGGVSLTAAAAATAASRRRYSRQLQEMGNRQRRSIQEGGEQVSATKQSDGVRLPSNNSDPVFVLRFMELLRPLQSSMSSLRDAGGGTSDHEDLGDEDEDEADAIFRQHERESSRILRICCSLDNLLFAIADQVQQHNNDLLAIARGPAHELVQLMLNGIRQIVAAMTVTQQPNGEPTGLPSLTAKEERYLRDFLVEIADRWSELDELLRGVFVANLETTQKELSDVQRLYAELKTEKQALELEMIDIREFSSNQSSATMAVTSNFMRLANQSDSQQRPESNDQDPRAEDEHLAGYDLTENQEKDGEQRTAAEEVEVLKKQCEEYGRLLEMAKQEIRLSHQERQSQHARLIELSQTLLKDEEVAQLRSELQSEKKRVKRLEIECLGLRETEIGLNMKIQSLQLNYPGSNSTGPSTTKSNVNIRGTPVGSTATPPHPRSRAGSAVITPEDLASTSTESTHPVTPPEADGRTGDATSPYRGEVHSKTASHLETHTTSPHVDVKAPWISRWVALSDTSVLECDDDGLIRRFFADLLMTDKEFEAAPGQSKLRKRASVPTVGAPPSSIGPAKALPPVKKKPKQTGISQDPNAVAIPVNEWAQDATVVSSARQLIWVFYELYLMAEEARRIDPQLSARAMWQQTTPPPLASFVVQYFLERHVSEVEALHRLRRFVFVLSRLRLEYGDIRLFCEFLDGQRSREELHFYLWSLQAIESVKVGVDYEMPCAVSSHIRLGRYVCTLKAVYVSRMIFHFLHVKSLKKPFANPPGVVTKQKPSVQATVEQKGYSRPAPTSPSKKRRKSRPTSAGAVSTTTTAGAALLTTAAPSDPDPTKHTVVDMAKQRYAHALAANSGYPLTLESFNHVVLSFAEMPSHEELLDRLGVFYQPTGDERKVALDVFLVLLMELFSTQLHWRKTQLHALFVRLAKDEELGALLAAKKRQEEADAAQGKKGRLAQPEKKANKKTKLSPSKKRQRRAGLDGSADKYLRGLNRERFRDFLVQGGLVTDFTECDMDALYVAVLETTDRTPSDIHFEDVYAALDKFEMLGNGAFAVDFSRWESNNQETSLEPPQPGILATTVDEWRQMSKAAIVMTENDPNKFTRRSARLLLRRLSASKFADPELEAICGMRGFLALAWRVACHRLNARADRRAQLQWCLTEFYHLNKSIRTIYDADDHYASTIDLGSTSKPPVDCQDDLAAGFDTHSLTRLLAASADASKSDVVVDQLQGVGGVLQRYSFHIAHLFDSYGSARFGSSVPGLTKDQWIAMANDLGLVYDHGLSVPTCETLFVTVGSAPPSALAGDPQSSEGPQPGSTVMQGGEAFTLDKSRFVVLLIRVAVQWHEAIKRKHKKRSEGTHATSKQEGAPLVVSQIMDKFCRQVLAVKAFAHPSNVYEADFHRKLADPLVARVLLEHRAFLRHIFFQFAKPVGDDGDNAAHTNELGERHAKSRHNSLVLLQFTALLRTFGLLESRDTTQSKYSTSPSTHVPGVLRLDETGAAYMFQAVMAVESDGRTQMEFDEFTAAVAAIAAMQNPHPFLLWHVKIDAFVQELRRRAPRTAGLGHADGLVLR